MLNKGIAASIALSLSFSSALAGTTFSFLPENTALDHGTILILAIFGGAVSFALLSAFWLIRERARLGNQIVQLKGNFSSIRAERDRLSALVVLDDQCTMFWDAASSGKRLLGKLDASSNVPEQPAEFFAFGKWLTAKSASELEKSIEGLRDDAAPFSLFLNSQAGTSLEAKGRISGGHPFVRFSLLEGTREKLVNLNSDYKHALSRLEALEKLFGELPAPVWMSDGDGKLTYVNSAYAQAVEAADPAASVSANSAFFDNNERNKIDKALKDDGAFYGTLPAVAAGDRHPFEVACVKTENGRAGIAIDRSDVGSVQAELKHAIASHQQTFDHLGSAVAIFDAQQKLQFHNSAFQQIWGLSDSELEGNPSNGDVLEALRNLKKLPEMPDWKKWKTTQLELYQATETSQNHWHLPDGTTLRVVANPQNQGGISWVFENVTEELTLKSNYNSLVRVQGETLDHLSEAVAVFGSDGKVRLTNPAFLSLWKFDDESQIDHMHIRDISEKIDDSLMADDEWKTICLGVTNVDENRRDLSGRLELKSKKYLDYYLVYLPEGQSMLTLADVTAAVNIERALQERNEALEESDALKTRFIQHVSYELRAPLTSIAGFAEILTSNATGKLNAKQSEYLNYISQGSDVLKGLIDNILDLATIDAGAMQLDLTSVNMADVIEDCIGSLEDQIKRHQITCQVDTNDKEATIIGDQGRLHQIIYNLVSNAITASPDGGVIKIKVEQDQQSAILSVSDQGPGIGKDERNAIFGRFESGTPGERRNGAGLGLPIVKSFVELHGGQVSVESTKGRGATFICVLPLEPANQIRAAE